MQKLLYEFSDNSVEDGTCAMEETVRFGSSRNNITLGSDVGVRIGLHFWLGVALPYSALEDIR